MLAEKVARTQSSMTALSNAPQDSLQIHGATKMMAVRARFLAESSSYVRVQECNKKGVGPLFMDVFGHYEQKTFGSAVDITTEI